MGWRRGRRRGEECLRSRNDGVVDGEEGGGHAADHYTGGHLDDAGSRAVSANSP